MVVEPAQQQTRSVGALWKSHWLKPAAFVIAVCAFLGVISVLALQMNHKLDMMGKATSDSVQWQLSQVEVEYLGVLLALDEADTASAMPLVREQFDIFYSRVGTLRDGMAFAELREDPAFQSALQSVSNMLRASVPIIDQSNADLLADLPELKAGLESQHDEVRDLGLNGIAYFAQRSVDARNDISNTMRRASSLTAAMIVALVGMVFVLWRIFEAARFHAQETKRIGERMTAVVETALDGVIIADVHGTIRDFNKAAETIFGYCREEVLQKPMADVIVPEELRAAHIAGMERYLRTGETRLIGKGRTIVQARRKCGKIIPLEMSLSSSHDREGKQIIISFVRDITNRLASEKELLEARDAALAGERAKERLLAVMSHEMRTPLNGILATLELLNETGTTPTQARYLSIIAQSGDLLLSQVNDVLDISRMEACGDPADGESFDFGTVIRDVVAEQTALASLNNCEIRAALFGDTRVTGDPVSLRRILHNLVGNAVKFTKDGIIEVSAGRLGRSDVVEICVSDTGIGIDPDDQKRIFDDFFRLDASYGRPTSGTGLGLGIVQRLVRQMGGEIGLESEPGEGSHFWLRLPLPASSDPMARTARPTSKTAPAQTKRALNILVVEDNEINRLVVREMLQTIGHTVTEAHDGQDGVALAEAQSYDLILMDISMPRMDGVEATRRIRSGGGASAASPIVALTANAMLHEIACFREAGMNETLTKPISRKSLDRALAVANSAGDRKTTPNSEPMSARSDGIIDEAQFRYLVAQIGPEKASRLFEKFVDQTEAALSDLAQAKSETRDPEDLVAVLHKLRGSSGMLGARLLSERLEQFEVMGTSGQTEQVTLRLDELSTIWAQTVPEFAKLQDQA